MALIKIVNIGDELVFDDKGGRSRISIQFKERTGRAIAMTIRADRSIPIEHIRAGSVVSTGTVELADEQSVKDFIEG